MVRLRSRQISPLKTTPLTHPLTPLQTKESSLNKPSPSPISTTKAPALRLQSDSNYGFRLDYTKDGSLMGFSEDEVNVFDSESQRLDSMRSPFEESLNGNGVNLSQNQTSITGLESITANGFGVSDGNGDDAFDKPVAAVSVRRRSARLALKADELGFDEGKDENAVDMFNAEMEKSGYGVPAGLCLRSGKRVTGRIVANGNVGDKLARGSGSKRKKEAVAVGEVKGDDEPVLEGLIDDGGNEKIGEGGDDDMKKRKGEEIEESGGSDSLERRLLRREEKGEVMVNDDNADSVLPGIHETELEDEMVKNRISNDGSSSIRRRKRYNGDEKGKEKLDADHDDALVDRSKRSKMELESRVMDVVEKLAVEFNIESLKRNVTERVGGSRMDQFRKTARANASRFAHFDSQVEGRPDDNVETPTVEMQEKVEDWPGPFSTAMKIIKDREKKLNSSHGASTSGKEKRSPIIWIPKNKGRGRTKNSAPLLQEMCMRILANNVDNITSLNFFPDSLRHRLCQLLCNSRRMNLHFFNLLVSDSPTEIRIKDCSWLTDDDFEKSFAGCDTHNLSVLQLDQCGRCMPDYTLSGSLACSPNSLPALTTLSLCGGCRISDVGLSSIVSSAPALKSLNISHCSLLSSDSIGILANSLGSVLHELYINDCQNMDPMAILPALKRLEQLQVLSVAGILNVCDKFMKEFLVARGHNMKELILSDCGKLTDSSVKVIAENCPGLCTIDLSNLAKLTDSALGYLANGCQEIQKLRLRRNSFSDEAVAAFLESRGQRLTEFSLNNVKKVDHVTALSIAKCSKMLQSLDLSWCRNLTDEALGLIVDSCLSLKILKLFGCGQITNVFLHGHTNPEVHIIGMKMSPLLDVQPQPTEYPLHYS